MYLGVVIFIIFIVIYVTYSDNTVTLTSSLYIALLGLISFGCSKASKRYILGGGPLEECHANLEVLKAELKEQQTACLEKIKELNRRIQDQALSRLGNPSLEAQLKERQTELENFIEKNRELEQTISQLKENLNHDNVSESNATIQELKDALLSQRREYIDEFNDLNSQLEQCEIKNAQYYDELNSMKTHITELEGKLKDSSSSSSSSHLSPHLPSSSSSSSSYSPLPPRPPSSSSTPLSPLSPSLPQSSSPPSYPPGMKTVIIKLPDETVIRYFDILVNNNRYNKLLSYGYDSDVSNIALGKPYNNIWNSHTAEYYKARIRDRTESTDDKRIYRGLLSYSKLCDYVFYLNKTPIAVLTETIDVPLINQYYLINYHIKLPSIYTGNWFMSLGLIFNKEEIYRSYNFSKLLNRRYVCIPNSTAILLIDIRDNKLIVLETGDALAYKGSINTIGNTHENLNYILGINLPGAEFKHTKLYDYYKNKSITPDIWIGFMILVLNTFDITIDEFIKYFTPKKLAFRGRTHFVHDPNSFGHRGVYLYANAIRELFARSDRIEITENNIN